MRDYMKYSGGKLIIVLYSCALSFFLIFILANGTAYLVYKGRVESFNEGVFLRTKELMKEIQILNDYNKTLSLYSPCGSQYLRLLREKLWPYALIKDIAYVNAQKIYCSALWGKVDPEFIKTQQEKIKTGRITWILNSSYEHDYSSPLVSYENMLITISPFTFTAFQELSRNHQINTYITTKDGNTPLIKIGNGFEKLLNLINNSSTSLTYIVKKKCGEDICVYSGGRFSGVKNENSQVQIFLTTITIIITTLLFVIINSHVNRNKAISYKLCKALNKKKLEIFYQPIYSIKACKTVGYEALLRWNDPKMGYISPDVFIPLATSIGITDKMSLYVTEKAIIEFSQLSKQRNLSLHINISASDLLNDSFFSKLLYLVKRYNMPANLIVLELSEREDACLEKLQGAINKYHSENFKIALDDFGTGSSNINRLTNLEVDEVKVDKFLISSIGTNSVNNKIFLMILGLLRNTSSEIVFEGVETKEQFDFLASVLPNAYVQGWYFSKAKPLKEIIDLISKDFIKP